MLGLVSAFGLLGLLICFDVAFHLGILFLVFVWAVLL
jgi:hypothetical protein